MKPRLAARPVFAVVLGLAPLAACATNVPEPCTAEWIDYKTDKILRKFALQNRSLVNDFRKLTRDGGDVDPFVAISLSRKSDEIRKFADSFNTVVLPELEAALDECGRHPEFAPALSDFLKEEGVSEEAISWIVPFIGVMTEMREGTSDSGAYRQD